MFLCNERCHDDAKCGCGIFGGSQGACECCGKVANCRDCHNPAMPREAPCKGECEAEDEKPEGG